jgi:hypothetical protein
VGLLLSASLWPSLRGQGEYFLFSPEKGLLFGAGKITLSLEGLTLTGQTLVLDARSLRIHLLGGVTLQRAGEPALVFDEVAVAPFPFRYRGRRYGERIEEGGDPGLDFPEPEGDLHRLRDVDLYFECTAFTLTDGKKLVGERVVPHLMGVPSLPLKKLLLQRTDQEGRTLFFLEKIDYSRSHGLLTELGLNLALRGWQGSNRLRLFERELMGVDGNPRGLILQGQNSWQSGGRSLFTVQHLVDSDDRSFQLSFSHGGSWKPLRYNLTQTFTGRAGESTLAMLRADLEMTVWNRLRPRLEVGSDFLGGGRWQLSLPVEANRFLRFNLGLEQRRLVQPVRREDLRFFSSLGFSSSFLTLDSNLEIGRDRLELASRRSFALRCAFPTLRLMGGNVAVDLAPFYTFTSLPTGDGQSVDSTPGFNLKAQSMGVTGPLGLILRPSLDVYQVWDRGNEGRTSFTTLLALEKRLGSFGLALDYTLASRLSMSSFWVEGYHLNALTLRVDWTNPGHGSVTGRLFYNNRFALESIGIQGHLDLPFRSRLSGTLIYEALQRRLLSLDLFLERELMRVFRLRGGYSWALKRFFVDLMQSF